ncbi:MAG: helix-turn-helix domain protein [bacterium]|nr:MAG: helix-turn-helix domain protein [bacterium]
MHDVEIGTSTFGTLLRRWRETRRMSQLELGLEATVSARHISFIETGRSKPSREMIVSLANVLDLALRDRNEMLLSAGFAPIYRETSLNDPQMAQVRQALELILKRQEPFGAIVFDLHWNLIMANEGYCAIAALILDQENKITPYAIMSPPQINLIKLLFDPQGWRPFIVNWEEVAKIMLKRLYRQTLWEQDLAAQQLLETVLRYPGVSSKWREPNANSSQELVIPLVLSLGDYQLSLFSTIASLGSPQDITLQELHIEAFHPANKETEEIVHTLMRQK